MLYINILFKNRTNKYIEKRKKMIHNHEVTSSILVLATKNTRKIMRVFFLRVKVEPPATKIHIFRNEF